MRIKAIEMSWFRGAADQVSMEANGKSLVVYGANGSGKSCFVDAIEYVLNNGKIGHLAHEYSGKHQEKAIHNTHKPEDQKTELKIRFETKPELKLVINPDGTFTSSNAEPIAMNTWDYGRTVLRQNEVAAFIHETKGDKYSALLPLLGLHEMEIAAENLRQLAKSVVAESKLTEAQITLKGIIAKRKETFGADSDDQILKKIEVLHSCYCVDQVATKDSLSRCKELETAIAKRIEQFSADQRRYLTLHEAGELDLKSHVDTIREANAKLTDAMEPLIGERLQILQDTAEFVKQLKDNENVKCPACGRIIPAEIFQAHVEAEQVRLQEIVKIFDAQKISIGTLCDNIKSLKSYLNKEEVSAWKDALLEGPLADNLTYLDEINAETLRASCKEKDLQEI